MGLAERRAAPFERAYHATAAGALAIRCGLGAEHRYPRLALGPGFGQLAGAVARAVVNDHPLHRPVALLAHRAQGVLQAIGLVLHGRDDRISGKVHHLG